MFRQLLLVNALPIPIDLRTFARSWGNANRNILTYLCHWLSEYMIVDSNLKSEFEHQFKSTEGPRPVLLLDSWDQLGDDLGTELHDKLDVFLRTYPRVLAVVTSRLYGKGRPGRHDNCEVMKLQPLDETEITALVRRYVTALGAGGGDAWNERITAAIKVSPQVEELASNPLLLTMMVAVGRDRELPGERHVLYQRCVEEMLSSECKIATHWRPANPGALDAVEQLAFSMQDFAYSRSTDEPAERRSVAVDVDRACLYLPRPWSTREKKHFLDWLVEACGILQVVGDGGLVREKKTYMFAHLSLQEYLAAVYISKNPNISIADRVFDLHWWETLRILAALVDREEADRRIAELLSIASGPSRSASFWLAGAVLADGNSLAFDSWLESLRDKFQLGEWRYSRVAASTWKASHQSAMRARITSDCADWTWVRWVRAKEWAREAGMETAFRIGNEGVCLRSTRAVATACDASTNWSSDAVAFSRVLGGSGPFWPAPHWELMLLRTWPSRRARLGQALQSLASVGADSKVLFDGAALWLNEPDKFLPLKGLLEEYIGQKEVEAQPRGTYARALARDLSLQFGHRIGQELSESPSVGIVAAEWAQNLGRFLKVEAIVDMAKDALADLCRRIAHESRPDLGRPWARVIISALSAMDVDVSASEPVWLDFGLVESYSQARHTTATALAFSDQLLGHRKSDERVALIASACRKFLQVGSQDFDERLTRVQAMDPIWPTLARHLAGLATEKDREFLEHAAAVAEHDDPMLKWGLRYYVRGDIITEDGELTLDEICHELHCPSLPFLERHLSLK